MKKLLIFSFVIMLLLAGCGKDKNMPADTEEISEGMMVAESMVDWVYYEDLAGLVIDSENIIVGKVEEKLPCIQRGSYDLVTPFLISVEQVMKGNLKEKDQITVTQLGGLSPDGEILYRYSGVEFLEEGERYLLFTGEAEGEYCGLMPPAVGDIRIEKGTLMFRDDQDNLFSETKDQVSIEEAAAEIVELANLPRNPVNGIMTEDVEWIEYEDGSVPIGETAAVYEKSYEIERILRQLRRLEPLAEKPEDYGECEPGGDVDFRIILGNGEQIDIECCGNIIRCGEDYYMGRITLPDNRFAARVERVWYCESGGYTDALNGADAEYPAFAVKSYEELTAFLQKYGECMGAYDAAVWLDGEYLSVDADYFKGNDLLMVYAPSTSGIEIGYKDHHVENGKLTVELEKYESGEHVAAEVGWLTCIPVEKDYFAEVSTAEVVVED